MIKSYPNPLLGFAGKRVHTRRDIDLLTTSNTNVAYRTLTADKCHISVIFHIKMQTLMDICSYRLTRSAFVRLRHSLVQNLCVRTCRSCDECLKTQRQRAP